MATTGISEVYYTAAGGTGRPLPFDLINGDDLVIYDLSSGAKQLALAVRIDVLEVDSVSEGAVVSIGTNSPSYNDLVPAFGVPGIENWSKLEFLVPGKLFTSGTEIRVRVDNPGSGTSFKALVWILLTQIPVED